ncbi:CPCC family cysteine-rich protein [Dactylosporangium matsuzakiense]
MVSVSSSKYPCVCCGHLTLDEPPGSYEICPVCFWEDDLIQLRWPDWYGGANRPCLIEAQQNFRRFAACDERSRRHTRPALNDEPLESAWRPIDPDRDRFEPHNVALAPWPDDRTLLYWWRYHDTGFWRHTYKP